MEASRWKIAIALIRNLLRHHPKPFGIAVGGASVYAICTVGSSFGVGYIIDQVIIARFQTNQIPWNQFWMGAVIVVSIGLIRAIGVVVRRSFAGISHWSTSQTLAQQIIDRVTKQPLQWQHRHMTGDLVARVGVDSDTAASVLGPLPFSVSVVLLVVLTAIWLVIIDVQLGALAVCVIPLLLLINLGYQKRIDRHFEAAQKALGQLSEAVHESFDGVLVVKAFGAGERESSRLALISERLMEARIKAVSARAFFEALVDGAPSAINILIIFFGSIRVQSGNLSIGELSSFIYLFTLLIFPLRIIGYLLSEIPHSSSGYKRVMEITQGVVEPNPKDRIGIATNGSSVELQNVSFAYDIESTNVLSSVSFKLQQGKVIAIVGATGSGKTTLLKIIAGIISPTSGSVFLSDKPAMVFQEPFLFSGTINFNLSLGKHIDVPRIATSLWASASEDFVSSMPMGTDTVIGERGISLSGGQRQRIGLARAVASNRSILLLDDTTSSLDPETESVVLHRLRSLATTTTTVMVASRPSTIAIADLVLFIHEGKVADLATSESLMSSNSVYKELMLSFEHDRADS